MPMPVARLNSVFWRTGPTLDPATVLLHRPNHWAVKADERSMSWEVAIAGFAVWALIRGR